MVHRLTESVPFAFSRRSLTAYIFELESSCFWQAAELELMSNFIRTFKKRKGMTPNAYRDYINQMLIKF